MAKSEKDARGKKSSGKKTAAPDVTVAQPSKKEKAYRGRPQECREIPKQGACPQRRSANKGRPGTMCHSCRAI